MTRTTVLRLAFLTLSAICLVGVFVSSASTAEITIRVVTLGPTEDEDYDGALVLKDYVESRTNGRVEVVIHPSGQFCGNERECVEGLQTGVVDVFMTTFGGVATLYGPAQVFDLPYMFRDDRIAECVLDGPIVDELRRAVLDADLGLRVMVATNTGGWRNFATIDREIRSPADLAGLKMRTIPAPIQQELVRQLGATPTPIAWSELYTALATGVVDGTKNGVQDIVGMKLDERLKHITLDGHAYMGAIWWFSDTKWRALDADTRRIVYDGFEHLKTVTRALPMRRQLDDYAAFEAGGGTVYVPTDAEKAAFREAAGGMRAWYTTTYGDVGEAWLTRLDAAVAACEVSTSQAFERSDVGVDPS